MSWLPCSELVPRLPRLSALIVVVLSFGCGESPPREPGSMPATATVWFEEVARERGLTFRHKSGHGTAHLMPEVMGGGAALFDMDGDEDLDVYLVQSGSLIEPAETQPGNRLFRNRGDGTFDDVTEGSGADDRGYGMGVAAGDYDGDGDTDLYVTNMGPNVLLRNDGDGRFSDQTERSGTGHPGWSASAAFFDYDLDGDLDLYVVNYIHWSVENENDCHSPVGTPTYCGPRTYKTPAMDALYRNDGDGSFTDVTEAMGIATAFGNGLGLVTADFDGDGWQDVFVANDGELNQLWINLQGQGFEDVALLRGCAADLEGMAKAGMGVATADVDDDGDLDLLVCNLYDEADSLYRNDGTFFADVTASASLAVTSRNFTRFGLGWVDFDNDGHFDLYEANGRVMYQSGLHSEDRYAEPNLLFRGTPAGHFEEVPNGGTAEPLIATSRAAAFGDLDRDGGVDVVVVNRDHDAYLLRNVVPDRGSWIAFRVLDRGDRSVDGTMVTLRVGDRRLRRDVRTAYSYLASNSPYVHVGLGDATRVDDVAVRWIDGVTQQFGSFDANELVTLRREE